MVAATEEKIEAPACGWIRVEDALPENDIWVIGYGTVFGQEEKRVVPVCFQDYHPHFFWWTADVKERSDLCEAIGVTHWQPLPEAPRGES
jgi:hypothetical protein